MTEECCSLLFRTDGARLPFIIDVARKEVIILNDAKDASIFDPVQACNVNGDDIWHIEKWS